MSPHTNFQLPRLSGIAFFCGGCDCHCDCDCHCHCDCDCDGAKTKSTPSLLDLARTGV
jgi:hypothetical protein